MTMTAANTRTTIAVLVGLLVPLVLQGCAALSRQPAVPQDL